MGTYVDPADCTDPAVTVTEAHCATADTRVEAALWGKGIDPADLTLPRANLTALGVAYATAQACLEKAKGMDSDLLAKSQLYEAQAKTLAAGLTPQSVGIVPGASSGGLGSIAIGRG